MHIRALITALGSILILASTAIPPIARASGAENASAPTVEEASGVEKNPAPAATSRPPAKPVPDTPKVYTNDDIGWFNPTASDAGASRPTQAAAAVSAASGTGDGAPSSTQPAPIDPQKDPQWYAIQIASLDEALAAIQSKEDQLKQFRATSTGLPTGLDLNAPCEGITTDNLIAQLQSRREQIEQQLDDLADLARVNGLPPGTVNQAPAPEQPSLTVAQEQDALTSEYRDISDELAENEASLNDMQQQAAAQNITLLPSVPGEGGNLTTNLLDRLSSQAAALENILSETEDDARALGVPPGNLR